MPSAAARRRPGLEPTLDAAVAELGNAIDELRNLTPSCRPSQLDAGIGAGFRELAERAPLPVTVEAPRRAAGPSRRGDGLLRRLRGSDQRDQARAGLDAIASRASTPHGSLLVSVADDGVGGAAPHAGSGWRAWPTASAPTAGTLTFDSDAGRHRARRGAPMRVVIAEDQALLREGLAGLFRDAGHDVLGHAGRRRRR